MKVEIYSKSNCAFCTKAKILLGTRKITYHEYLVQDLTNKHLTLEEHQTWISREDLLSEFPNARTVPQIKIDGEPIGGYENLVARLDA